MVLVWSGASDGRINGPAKIEINSGGVLAGDFNGDHKTDLLTLSGSLLLSRGSVFEPAVPIKPGAWLSGAVADFDRDGSPDIVLGGYSRLSVLLNTAK